MFPSNSTLSNVAGSGMNSMNTLNGTLPFNGLAAQFPNGVNGLNGLTLSAYATNMNNVAAMNAMNSMVGGLNLQNINGQGVTGFTPTFEGDRSLANSINNLSTADFGWHNNFVGLLPDGNSYQQNMTSNGSSNQINTSFGGMNMSFPSISKLQGLGNSTSPTSVLSNISSLSGQSNMFSVHNQMDNGDTPTAQNNFQRQDSMSMKLLPTSNMLPMRNTNVNVGN